jgi:signal transduction histidine kinase
LQLAIISILLSIPNETAPRDYFTNLVLPISGQAAWNFPVNISKRWILFFCLFCASAMEIVYPGTDGLGFAITYIAGILLMVFLIAMTMRADQARSESQTLLAELTEANQKLQEYAVQVERLAAAEERNRLARELHDSVSQTIFSMTLTAQAARILADRDPGRIPQLLDHLQTLSQNALAEMRSLIEHLRPPPLQERGLIPALRSHIEERKSRDNLAVTLQVDLESKLTEAVEEGVFRITQEALNNVVKHAKTGTAAVTIEERGGTICLVVEDHGSGFDPSVARKMHGHIGLSSMEERVKAIGGRMKVESAPGKGTRLMVEGIPCQPPAAEEMEPEKDTQNA